MFMRIQRYTPQNATSRVEVSGIGGVGLDSQVLDRFFGGEQYVQIMVLFEKFVASNFKSFLFSMYL